MIDMAKLICSSAGDPEDDIPTEEMIIDLEAHERGLRKLEALKEGG